uniref:PAZ domain-containing protein n=1 Tax=Mesocestoides corti TaxID=53468 RepID=A0A5K3FPG0_MESCO
MYDLEPTRAFREENHDLEAKPRTLRNLLKIVVNEFPEDTFYDGGRILYSLKKLDGVGAESVKRLVPVADPLERDDLWLEYTIQEVKRISASSIFEYLNNPYARTSEIPQDAINMVDNLLKWVNRKTFVNFGRSAMFFPDPKQRVDQKLFVIHSGFMFSVRPQWKVRMNIDMVHKAFFPTGNLADILYAKYEESIYDQRNWPMMLADINGIRVEADHYKTEKGKSYKKRFTVFGLSPDSAEREMIPELKISIMAYFDKQYSIKLKYPELPCIKTKKDKNEYIPMELLTVLPYQNPNADKGDIASAVIRCAAVRPGDRFKELDSFVNQFMRNQHCLLKQFKLKLPNSKPVTVDARELPQPTGQFQGAPMSLGRGKWNPLKFYRPASGQVTWAVFATPVSRFSQQGISTVLRELPRAANNCGLDVSAQPFLAQPVPPAHLEQKFDECQRNV